MRGCREEVKKEEGKRSGRRKRECVSACKKGGNDEARGRRVVGGGLRATVSSFMSYREGAKLRGGRQRQTLWRRVEAARSRFALQHR